MIRRFITVFLTLTVGLASYSMPSYAKSPTTIKFSSGEYCGSYTGNIKQGKVFRLWLLDEQDFVIENTGNGLIKVDYVKGPGGLLQGRRTHNYQSYYVNRSGQHDILIYGNSDISSVDFCAY